MEAKMILSVLACALVVRAAAAEAPASSKKETGQDLETAESARFYGWNSGSRPYQPSNYPNYWYTGNGYQYTNPNYYNQYYPNTGYNYPGYGYNYPNFGYSNNGFGYPGGYSNGYPGGYGGYPGFGNGYSTGYPRYNYYDSRYRTNPDLPQQTTARGGYIYKR